MPPETAALNNAEWCAALCSAHGLETSFAAELWWSPTRTPPYYPDAVTLAPGVDGREILTRVDPAHGCSVKDSFADLDLAPAGFRPLFRARWISRAPPDELQPDAGWSRVTTPAALEEWEASWGEAAGLFVPRLLAVGAVRVLARRDGGRVVAGAVVNRSASVIGISNLFDEEGDLERAWAGAARAAVAAWGPMPLVGYDSGASLEAECRAGFAPLGDLVVWVS